MSGFLMAKTSSIDTYIFKNVLSSPGVLILVLLCCIVPASGMGIHLYPVMAAMIAEGYDDDEDMSDDNEGIIEDAVSFAGWKNDSAVYVMEHYNTPDSITISYMYSSPTCGWGVLNYSAKAFQQIRSKLSSGTVIFPAVSSRKQQLYCTLSVDADSQFLRHIDTIFPDLDVASPLPSSPGEIRIQLLSSSENPVKKMTIWRDKIPIRPYHGENGIEFELPYLNTALLNASNSAILIEYTVEGVRERLVLDIAKTVQQLKK